LQPTEAPVTAVSAARIRSFFIAGLSITKRNREGGDGRIRKQGRDQDGRSLGVEQLYTTPNDVQMKHADFFSPQRLFFATHVRGLGVMFSRGVAGSRAVIAN
jgi:hypothetical protein